MKKLINFTMLLLFILINQGCSSNTSSPGLNAMPATEQLTSALSCTTTLLGYIGSLSFMNGIAVVYNVNTMTSGDQFVSATIKTSNDQSYSSLWYPNGHSSNGYITVSKTVSGNNSYAFWSFNSNLTNIVQVTYNDASLSGSIVNNLNCSLTKY